MSDFTHVILTRFNAKFAASWTDLALDPDWLKHRFELFEQFCYPSVRNQTTENFIWLVFFSDKTPLEYKNRINQLAEQWPVMRPLFHDYLSGNIMKSETLKHVSKEHEYIITTTLDNDDAISKNFIEEVQKQFSRQSYQYINWASGYVYHTNKKRFYKRFYLESPFYSLIERRDGCRLVWNAYHTELLKSSNVIQLDKNPGWIQVVHSKNISNRIKGKRIKTPEIKQLFTIIMDEATKESEINIFIDRNITYYVRLIRDIIINILKRFINLQGLRFRIIKLLNN